jgi:adenylate cyclase
MNRGILFIFLLWSYCAPAQQRKNGVTVLTKDTLTYEHSALVRLGDNWRFYKGDSIGYALPGFNDSGWVVITANVRIDTGLLHKPGYYSRISWYRLHINVDTSIVNIPLSFYIVGAGAYEIYLDGNKIKNYGVIRPGGRSEFYSPHTPLIFQIKSVGDHVIAIRYANYSTGSIFKNEDVALTGFEIYLGEANAVVFSITGNLIVNTTIFIFLFATFICLSVIHLLLFLYYRSIPSNLYFSIFCLSLATIFFMSYYGDVSSDPGVGLNTNIIVPVSAAVLLFSFSGINNELFSRKKLRFRLIGICCFLILIVSFLKQNFAAAAYFGIAGIVLIEGLVLPVAGIYRKVRGARIVGSGVLFFTFFIIFCFVYGFIHKGLSFSNDGIEVTLFKIFASCAILSIPFSMSIYLSWNFASVNKDMKLHLLEVERLSAQALEQEQEKKRMLESQNEQLEREVTILTA